MTGGRTPAATASRTSQHLAALRSRYPRSIEQFDSFSRGRGSASLGNWPDWCYLPMAAAVAIVSGGGTVTFQHGPDISRVAALGAWRLGRGIYRFDPDLWGELVQTELPEDVPVAALYRLPEYCLYLDLPETEADALGAYVWLEHDVNTKRPELRILLDTGHGWDGLLGLPLMLDRGSLSEVLRGPVPPTVVPGMGRRVADSVFGRILGALLYLCAQNAEISDPRQPDASPARATGVSGRGPREPRQWEVGYRIGARLRAARDAEGGSAPGGDRRSPRPHLRRAHWHHYWTGPRDGERSSVLRWLTPVLVGADSDEDLVPTVHRVE